MLLTKKWSRRRFLEAAGIGAGAAALLPYIPRLASADAPPARRLITFTMPMTTLAHEWRQNGDGTPFRAGGAALPELRGMHAPLDAMRDKLVILRGIEATVANPIFGAHTQSPGLTIATGGHYSVPTLWTGTSPYCYGSFSFPDYNPAVADTHDVTARGWSIDQAVHARLRRSAPHLQSLQLDCHDPTGEPLNGLHCASFGQPNAGETGAPQLFPGSNPQSVFDQLFGSISAAPDDPRRMRRRHVLDAVAAQMSRLRGVLPSEDRVRLDQHHQGILDLQTRLSTMSASCTTPPRPDAWGLDREAADPRGCARAMFELIRLGFECDLVRCVSFLCGSASEGLAPQAWDPSIPLTRDPGNNGLHMHSHEYLDHPDSEMAMRMYNRSMVDCLADLVHTLESGANTMDDTIIAVQGPMLDSATHATRVPPCSMLLAGASTPIRTNQFVQFGPDEPEAAYGVKGDTCDNNRLLTTLGQAMGMSDMTTFGYVGNYDFTWSNAGGTTPGGPVQHAPIAEVLR